MLGFRPKCNVYSLVEVVLRIGRLPTQTPMIFSQVLKRNLMTKFLVTLRSN